MESYYCYQFHDGNTSSFCVPMHNGQIITNRFMHRCLYPQTSDSLIPSSAVRSELALQDPEEFSNDISAMIRYINEKKKPSNLDTTYMEAVVFMVANHIKLHGRLFVADLGAYLDEASWLMFGFGFSEEFLKNHTYPQMAYILIKDLGQYIIEGTPYGIIPYTSTEKWKELRDYCLSKGL